MNIQNKIADYLKKIGKIVEKIMMILVTCSLISIIPHCYYSNKQTEEWLAEPQIGDIYYVNLAKMDEIEITNPILKTEAYSLLKLISIDDKNLTFLVHRKMTGGTRKRRLFTYKSGTDFLGETVAIPVKRIHEYHANGVITEIKRK